MADAENARQRVTCSCGKVLDVTGKSPGKRLACPKCKRRFTLDDRLQAVFDAPTAEHIVEASNAASISDQRLQALSENSAELLAPITQSSPESVAQNAELPSSERTGQDKTAANDEEIGSDTQTLLQQAPDETPPTIKDGQEKKANSESGVFLTDDDFFEIKPRAPGSDPGATSSYSLDGGTVISNAKADAERIKAERELHHKWGDFDPTEPGTSKKAKTVSRTRSRREESALNDDGETLPHTPLNVERLILPFFVGVLLIFLVLGLSLGWIRFKDITILGYTLRGSNPLVWIGGMLFGALLFLGFWVLHTYFFIHRKKKQKDSVRIDVGDLETRGSSRRERPSERKRSSKKAAADASADDNAINAEDERNTARAEEKTRTRKRYNSERNPD